MKDSVKKLIICIGFVAAVIVVCILMNLKDVSNFHDKYAGADLSTDVEGAKRNGTYTEYLMKYEGAKCPSETVSVDPAKYVEGEDVEVTNDYPEYPNSLYTGDKGEVTWEVDVKEAGFYNLYLEYMTVKSKGVSIERSIYINGELPFQDASSVVFTRIWKDASEPKVDNQGNEIRPTQIEEYTWQSAFCKDKMGYITTPYWFYLEKGKNTITFKTINEPMVIGKLEVRGIKENPTYAEYEASLPAVHASGSGADYMQLIQGEDSVYRSESSLYAKYDRASPTTKPYSIMNTILNYVGGDSWRSSGQWIEWECEVPEDGYYHLNIKGRQNYARGSVSSRTLYIDNEIPFKEVEEISFDYNNEWDTLTLADENGKAYSFYLTAGKHSIKLEATLGGIGKVMEELEDSTFRLNQMYRKILVYTGASPDPYRDYRIDKMYPEVIEAMDLESKRLYRMVDEIVEITGQKDDKIATAQTLAQQLERFVKKPEKIPVEFGTFKDNITALGTAILGMSEIKLDIDYLVVYGENAKPTVDHANWFAKAWHEIKSFGASFIVDYNAVGDVYDEDEVIKVWVMTGRDQGTILKTMVDDTFTPESGVKVNVEIVAADALLNAVVAGRGPDVVLSVGADQPVNYALRNAAEDLTQFPDYQEVLKEFNPSCYRQYSLDDHLYGLPETMSYNVMFYRKDVLEELGLDVPKTWQELIEMLPTIQGNNLSVGIPSAAGSTVNGTASVVDLSMYFTLLYQYGGELYNEDGTATIINDEEGVEAFEAYTRYFTDYGIPTVYDFVSRFRSGEMPIGVANFATYNTLVVSAPEIAGLWDFTTVPGTERVDENGNEYVDKSAFISGQATMMIKSDNEEKKKQAWEFMKWWVKSDTQVRFGRELEALLGSSARYATANKAAFEQLAWSAEDIAVLEEQLGYTVGIREVPGGYYTGRHISNAIRKIINESTDPRETILDYSITIDEEITKKRKEFNLPVAK